MRLIALSLGCLWALAACGRDDGPSVPNPIAQSGEANPERPINAPESRLADLPETTRDLLLDCESKGFVYDLGRSTCTELKPSAIHCALDPEFQKLVSTTVWERIHAFLDGKGVEMNLYACTEETDLYYLHFYYLKSSVIHYQKLNVPKKSDL